MRRKAHYKGRMTTLSEKLQVADYLDGAGRVHRTSCVFDGKGKRDTRAALNQRLNQGRLGRDCSVASPRKVKMTQKPFQSKETMPALSRADKNYFSGKRIIFWEGRKARRRSRLEFRFSRASHAAALTSRHPDGFPSGKTLAPEARIVQRKIKSKKRLTARWHSGIVAA